MTRPKTFRGRNGYDSRRLRISESKPWITPPPASLVGEKPYAVLMQEAKAEYQRQLLRDLEAKKGGRPLGSRNRAGQYGEEA